MSMSKWTLGRIQNHSQPFHQENKEAEGFAEFYIPFSSLTKKATAVIRNPRVGGVTVFMKGAPEIVMEHCDTYTDANGNEAELTDEKKSEIK